MQQVVPTFLQDTRQANITATKVRDTMSLATERDMGTTVPLFLTRDITTIDEDTTLSSPTKDILVDMKVTVALFLMEWAILPTRQGMVDMEHKGAINTAVSIGRSTPSVVTTLQVLKRTITSPGVNPIIRVIMEETMANVAVRPTAADMEAMKEVMASMGQIIKAATESPERTV